MAKNKNKGLLVGKSKFIRGMEIRKMIFKMWYKQKEQFTGNGLAQTR